MALGDQIKTLFRFRHGTQLVDMPTDTALAPGAWTTLPTCNSDFRGAFARSQGGTGVADTVAVCRKEADDTYAWSTFGDTSVLSFPGEAAIVYTDLPAAATVSSSGIYVLADFSGYTEYRVMAQMVVAGSVSAVLGVAYSLDGSVYTPLAGTVSIASTGLVIGDWAALPAEAQDIVSLTPYAAGGNDDADPRTDAVAIMLRA